MITIGTKKVVAVKRRDSKTKKLVQSTGPDGSPETRIIETSVWRVTNETLKSGFGPDNRRRLVVGLVAPDQIEFRPQGTRRAIRANLKDLYRHVIWCQAQRELLEKARARKARIAQRRASRRLASAERRFKARVRAENASDRD